VLARAGDLAGRFDEASSSLDNSQLRVNAELSSSVSQINGLISSVARTNQRIAVAQGAQQTPNDLLDERDRLITALSELVKVTRINAEDGSVGLFTADGQRLVLGSSHVTLEVLPHEADPQRSVVGVIDFGINRTLDENALGGGRVAGLLRYQNNDLMMGRNMVGRMAAALAGAINKQQTFGLNLQNPIGQVASQPMFATGPSLALGFQTNARDAMGVFVGSVALTITEPTALEATAYELREAPGAPGSWQVTRLSDGRVTNVADGDTVDGFRMDFGAPGPQSGDQYLLEPVTRAASGMQRLLNDPRDIAAALPLVATKGTTNVGTVGVASLQMTTTPLPAPGATARFTFSNDQGDYTWELRDAGNAVISSGSGTWTPGQPVPTAPVDINGFSLLLEGVPRTGDTLSVSPTPASAVATNNGNALLLMDIRDSPVVGGRSPTDAWALALSEVGVRTQGGKTAAEISSAVATSAESVRGSAAGVNLDEEAATLIQYQQTYQAAAKVLQVAQALFDSLMQAAGR
jgi:flagellar hook-associated protein 1 FlgK